MSYSLLHLFHSLSLLRSFTLMLTFITDRCCCCHSDSYCCTPVLIKNSRRNVLPSIIQHVAAATTPKELLLDEVSTKDLQIDHESLSSCQEKNLVPLPKKSTFPHSKTIHTILDTPGTATATDSTARTLVKKEIFPKLCDLT